MSSKVWITGHYEYSLLQNPNDVIYLLRFPSGSLVSRKYNNGTMNYLPVKQADRSSAQSEMGEG
jgi:hypothetical protein